MSNHFPITPTPELVREWARFQNHENPEALWRRIATLAARWGADQELEACAEWVNTWCTSRYLGDAISADVLRTARRPKPPSLKEQALESLERVQDLYPHLGNTKTIRRALEALDD
jgi:hypothetical protein